MILYIYLTAIG